MSRSATSELAQAFNVIDDALADPPPGRLEE